MSVKARLECGADVRRWVPKEAEERKEVADVEKALDVKV